MDWIIWLLPSSKLARYDSMSKYGPSLTGGAFNKPQAGVNLVSALLK